MFEKLNSKHFADIMDIHAKSIFPVWKSLGRKHNRENIMEFVKELFEIGEVYGYFVDKNIVGTLEINFRDGEKGVIEFILVLPEFQGKGVSKELMKFAEHFFSKKEIKTITLEVIQKNKRAVNFFKRVGYKTTKEFLKNEVPKYIMEKEIG